ncbi:MAG: hypothetical protein KBB32_03540 [Spirochaetia bacterium]|nr:hypothetical protein [Spirochaetia bacterium]
MPKQRPSSDPPRADVNSEVAWLETKTHYISHWLRFSFGKHINIRQAPYVFRWLILNNKLIFTPTAKPESEVFISYIAIQKNYKNCEILVRASKEKFGGKRLAPSSSAETLNAIRHKIVWNILSPPRLTLLELIPFSPDLKRTIISQADKVSYLYGGWEVNIGDYLFHVPLANVLQQVEDKRLIRNICQCGGSCALTGWGGNYITYLCVKCGKEYKYAYDPAFMMPPRNYRYLFLHQAVNTYKSIHSLGRESSL